MKANEVDKAQIQYGSDIDVFDESFLENPYALYRELQEVGPLAYLKKHSIWIATRYDTVKRVLEDVETFRSGHGIGLNSIINDAWEGSAPTSDGAVHKTLRGVMMQSFGPRGSALWKEDIERVAVLIVDSVVERGEFDAVRDFGQMMPIISVVNILGLDPDLETRRNLAHWATDAYNCCGPIGTFDSTIPSLEKLYSYALSNLTRENVRAGSVGAQTFDAVDRGVITEEQASGIIGAYFTAGLDTTAAGIGNLMYLLSQHPDQWAMLVENPELVSSAFQEAVRLESPAQWFSRVTSADCSFEDISITSGTRMMHSYGAANRDERMFKDASRFDVRRNPTNHLGFGSGVHSCMGKWLSAIEVNALMNEFVKRVKTLEPAGSPVIHINNLIRGYESIPVKIQAK